MISSGNAGRRIRRSSCPLGGDFVEASAVGKVDCVLSRQCLPAADGDVNIARLDLKRVTAAPDTLGGKECCARPRKRIEHDVSAPRAVLDAVGNERHWLHGRMRVKLIQPSGSERVDAGIMPHIGAIATVPAEFDVVDMRRIADAEDGDKLMLTAVKAALAGVVFDPRPRD